MSDDPSDLGKLKCIDDTKWYLVKGKCFCEGRVRREEELRVRGRDEGGEEGVREKEGAWQEEGHGKRRGCVMEEEMCRRGLWYYVHMYAQMYVYQIMRV